MFSYPSRRLIFRSGAFSPFSFRAYSRKNSPPPPQITNKKWKLPEIDPTGRPIEPDPNAEVIERGNRLGLFIDDRPNVPVQWRKRTDLPAWQRQRFALKEKFYGRNWNPPKKLSRPAMDGIRYLKSVSPDITASELASQFQVSPEAIRRILKSKWRPEEEQLEKIKQRWRRRGEMIREQRRALGKSTGEIEMDPPERRRVSTKKRSPKKEKVLRDLGNDDF